VKIIGKTMDGGMLIGMSIGEFAAVKGAALVLAGLPDLDIPAPVPAPVVAVETWPAAVVRPARAKAPRAHKAKAGNKARRLCIWCKKPLPEGVSPLTKTHEGACKREYARKYARELYQKKHGDQKPVATVLLDQGETPNPSDPMLSDEKRKAARLEIIKRAAAKHAEN